MSLLVYQQVLQLAIDHAVHLCVVYSWGNDTNMVNVLDGVPLDGLGLTAKGAQHGRVRKWEHVESWLVCCSQVVVIGFSTFCRSLYVAAECR